MDELISIVVPVYNSERYIKRCLNSLKNQTYSNLEIICIDDGSTDCSGSIIDDYAKDDSRFKIIHKMNSGVSSARNVGLEKASGKYLCFVDSDDWVDEKYVEILYKGFVTSSSDLSLCGYKEYLDDGNINEFSIGKTCIGIIDRDFESIYSFLKSPWLKMYNNDIISKEHLRFDTDISTGEDQIFNFDYYDKIKTYCFMNDCLYFYERHMNSLSYKSSASFLQSDYKCLARKKKFFMEHNVDSDVAKKIIANDNCYIVDRYVLFDEPTKENDFKSAKKRLAPVLGKYKFTKLETRREQILNFMFSRNILWPYYFFKKIKHKRNS